jgi:TonB family protein
MSEIRQEDMQDNFAIKKAFVFSLGLHVVLAIIFFFSRFELVSLPVQKLIEIVNYGVSQPVETGSNTQQASGLETPVSHAVSGAVSSSAPDNIDLPKTTSQSDDEMIDPVNSRISFSELEESDIAGNVRRKVESGLDAAALSVSDIKPEIEQTSVKADRDFLADLRKKIASEDSDKGGYSLSGEVLNRKILNKVIPEYPAGLQQNSEVEIRFEVQPDGKVSENAVIIRKGGPLLDQASIDAIKQWRFNPITGNHIQTGVITFSYKLE